MCGGRSHSHTMVAKTGALGSDSFDANLSSPTNTCNSALNSSSLNPWASLSEKKGVKNDQFTGLLGG